MQLSSEALTVGELTDLEVRVGSGVLGQEAMSSRRRTSVVVQGCLPSKLAPQMDPTFHHFFIHICIQICLLPLAPAVDKGNLAS